MSALHMYGLESIVCALILIQSRSSSKKAALTAFTARRGTAADRAGFEAATDSTPPSMIQPSRLV